MENGWEFNLASPVKEKDRNEQTRLETQKTFCYFDPMDLIQLEYDTFFVWLV